MINSGRWKKSGFLPTFLMTRVPGLSNEARQKLGAVHPLSVGQASRIPGITPAAIFHFDGLS